MTTPSIEDTLQRGGVFVITKALGGLTKAPLVLLEIKDAVNREGSLLGCSLGYDSLLVSLPTAFEDYAGREVPTIDYIGEPQPETWNPVTKKKERWNPVDEFIMRADGKITGLFREGYVLTAKADKVYRARGDSIAEALHELNWVILPGYITSQKMR